MTAAPAGSFLRSSDENGASLLLRADVAPALVAAGVADPEHLRGRAEATYAGRGEPFGVSVDGVGRVFVRPYLHGGLLGRVTGDRHAGDGRFIDEVRTLVAAAAAGVPVPEVLGVVSLPGGLGLRRGWLLTRELPGARDLLDLLEDGGLAAAERRGLLARAGRAMRTLHDAGFDHPDLHLKNLLVTPDGGVLVLDLDRVRRRAELSRERRIAGLFRFDRHAEKQAARGAPVTRGDRWRVLRSYAGDAWPERSDLRVLARRLERHVARHARKREGSLR